MTDSVGSIPLPDEPWMELTASRGFAGWLAENDLSLAFSTYQSGKLFLLGRNAKSELSIFERTFARCMGLWADGQTLWMSSLYQIWRFENALAPGEQYQGYDRLYVPRTGHTTGDLDAHDLACDADGRLIFANTKFSCIAGLSERGSFTPLWRPPFVDQLAPEDRCHLNGFAMVDDRCRYVTVVSRSDIVGGWREHRREGGCVLEVPSGKVVASGLSMPHSPRLYRGKLWVLNSGTGHLGSIDVETGTFEPLVFCPGYLRGLMFVGDFAVVGLSRPRHEKTFDGLALQENLKVKQTEARCGLMVVRLSTGHIEQWVQIDGLVQELYDVVALPGVVRPMALGFKTDEIQRLLTIGPPGSLS
jgi:uncharacterized protein (TIGR03032 family)